MFDVGRFRAFNWWFGQHYLARMRGPGERTHARRQSALWSGLMQMAAASGEQWLPIEPNWS